LSSSGASSPPASQRSLPCTLEELQGLRVAYTCTKFTRDLLEEVERLNRSSEVYASIVPLRLAREKGLQALLAAHTAAALAWRRGRGIARVKGLDTLLYLSGTRNIARVLEQYAPREGEPVAVLVASPGDPPTPPGEECSIPPSSRLTVTEAALFPVEARVYRQAANGHSRHT